MCGSVSFINEFIICFGSEFSDGDTDFLGLELEMINVETSSINTNLIKV